MGVLLYVICCFFLVVFNILPLIFSVWLLHVSMCSSLDLFCLRLKVSIGFEMEESLMTWPEALRASDADKSSMTVEEVKGSVAQLCPTLCKPMACPWNSPGKKTGVGSLLQGIFLTQGSNLGVLHCRKILYHLSYWRKINERWGIVITDKSERIQNPPHLYVVYSFIPVFSSPDSFPVLPILSSLILFLLKA